MRGQRYQPGPAVTSLPPGTAQDAVSAKRLTIRILFRSPTRA